MPASRARLEPSGRSSRWMPTAPTRIGPSKEQLLHLRRAAEQDRSDKPDQAEGRRRRPGRLPAGVLPAREELIAATVTAPGTAAAGRRGAGGPGKRLRTPNTTTTTNAAIAQPRLAGPATRRVAASARCETDHGRGFELVSEPAAGGPVSACSALGDEAPATADEQAGDDTIGLLADTPERLASRPEAAPVAQVPTPRSPWPAWRGPGRP